MTPSTHLFVYTGARVRVSEKFLACNYRRGIRDRRDTRILGEKHFQKYIIHGRSKTRIFARKVVGLIGSTDTFGPFKLEPSHRYQVVRV